MLGAGGRETHIDMYNVNICRSSCIRYGRNSKAVKNQNTLMIAPPEGANKSAKSYASSPESSADRFYFAEVCNSDLWIKNVEQHCNTSSAPCKFAISDGLGFADFPWLASLYALCAEATAWAEGESAESAAVMASRQETHLVAVAEAIAWIIWEVSVRT